MKRFLKMGLTGFLLVWLCMARGRVAAMQATPFPFPVKQPDGSVVSLYLRGNEHFNFLQDALGYPVVEMNVADNKRMFVYATQDAASGQLIPTPFTVGQADPVQLGLSVTLTKLPSPFVQPSSNDDAFVSPPTSATPAADNGGAISSGIVSAAGNDGATANATGTSDNNNSTDFNYTTTTAQQPSTLSDTPSHASAITDGLVQAAESGVPAIDRQPLPAAPSVSSPFASVRRQRYVTDEDQIRRTRRLAASGTVNNLVCCVWICMHRQRMTYFLRIGSRLL